MSVPQGRGGVGPGVGSQEGPGVGGGVQAATKGHLCLTLYLYYILLKGICACLCMYLCLYLRPPRGGVWGLGEKWGPGGQGVRGPGVGDGGPRGGESRG